MNTTYPKMHVSYYVSDINATTEFYNKFFQTDPAKVKPGYAKYILDHPALVISFIENPAGMRPDFGHLGFQVETREVLEEKLDKAKRHGLITLEEKNTSCCYALQDKFWVSDPDGYRWEVYYFEKDVEVNDPEYSPEQANACCAPNASSAKSTANSCCA